MQESTRPDVVDVVVVGAGLSGLVAARHLSREGHTVTVLEAADRWGGRALSETTPLGSRVDLGGQWIGHDHHRLAALVDEVGAHRYVMHTDSLPTLLDGPQRIRLTSLRALAALLLLACLEVTRRVRPSGPDRWLSTTVQDWLDRLPARTRRVLEIAALVSWTADLDRISVRTMMRLIRAQGGVVTMLSTKGGAQDSLIVEGAGHLTDVIAHELGDAVRLGWTATRIARDDDGVVVTTPRGEVVAQAAIITVPPPMAVRIEHDPALPPAPQLVGAGTFMGSVYKAIAVYPTPFWRPASTGELLLLDEPGGAVFDTSPPNGPGHLCLLVGGDEARALDDLDPATRRADLLARMAVALGPRTLAPTSWHEKSWHLDPHAGGGYLALPDRGADIELPMPADPIGRVHWAGTETAADHPGYLDGAIESGERAAREALATSLSRGRPRG